MEISLILAEEITKLFIIMAMGWALVRARMAMGWALVRARVLKTEDSRVISAIIVYLVAPCIIISSFQIEHSRQVVGGLLFSFAAAVFAHALFLLLAALFGRALHLDTEKLTVVYTNAGILVLPLVQAMLGGEYLVYSCAFIVVQLILLWTHCRCVLSGSAGIGWRKILFNLNVISIFIGGAMFLLGVRLPEIVDGTLKMTGSMIGPLGMLLAGMVIADVPARRIFGDRRRYLASALRLVAAPVILLLAFKICGAAQMIPDGKNILLVVYLAGVTPACATVTSMAQLYGDIGDRTGVLYVLTTLLSIVTMPLVIALYEAVI